MVGLLRYLKHSLRLRRVEYRIAELPIFLIPVLLTVRATAAFASLPFWEGLAVFFFLFAFGDLLNCLADRELDALDKPHLSEAVHGIGVRGVAVQAAISGVAALGLAVHLAWLLERWILPAATALGLVLAYAYSIEPLRLKGRGLWQLAFYWLGLFTGPMLFAALLFDPWPAAEVWAVSLAFGMLQSGVILVNTAEDYPEDRQLGVRTVIVTLGLERGIALAAVLTTLGSAALLVTLASAFIGRGAPAVAWSGLLPLAAACLAVSGGVFRLRRRLVGADEVAQVASVKLAGGRVPLWITGTALGGLLAAATIFGTT